MFGVIRRVLPSSNSTSARPSFLVCNLTPCVMGKFRNAFSYLSGVAVDLDVALNLAQAHHAGLRIGKGGNSQEDRRRSYRCGYKRLNAESGHGTPPERPFLHY